MLIIFSGLPGTGKTTIGRQLAHEIGAMHLRIDSIEQALLKSTGFTELMNEAGYLAAYAVAEDNLGLGRTVVADSVNPLPVTRDAWIEVAARAQVPHVEIEFVCSDTAAHRVRVETRPAEFAGRSLTWEDVLARDYRPWNRSRRVIDTGHQSVAESVKQIRELLAAISRTAR